MKVLLDECVPAGLAKHLVRHDCTTVAALGLAGMKNGDLLSSAERFGFELFVTIDQGLAYQQNLSGRRIAILILRAPSNRLPDLLNLVPECLEVMAKIKSGELKTIGA